jgi:hypothetical protein
VPPCNSTTQPSPVESRFRFRKPRQPTPLPENAARNERQRTQVAAAQGEDPSLPDRPERMASRRPRT